jgi:hypothetical protein
MQKAPAGGAAAAAPEKYGPSVSPGNNTPNRFWTLDSTPAKVPMAPTHYRDGEVVSDYDKLGLTPPKHETFRAILGSVNFMCMCCRHDIAFVISVISMRHTTTMQLHITHLKRMLRYLNNTRSMGITNGMPSHDNTYDIKVL